VSPGSMPSAVCPQVGRIHMGLGLHNFRLRCCGCEGFGVKVSVMVGIIRVGEPVSVGCEAGFGFGERCM